MNIHRGYTTPVIFTQLPAGTARSMFFTHEAGVYNTVLKYLPGGLTGVHSVVVSLCTREVFCRFALLFVSLPIDVLLNIYIIDRLFTNTPTFTVSVNIARLSNLPWPLAVFCFLSSVFVLCLLLQTKP